MSDAHMKMQIWIIGPNEGFVTFSWLVKKELLHQA